MTRARSSASPARATHGWSGPGHLGEGACVGDDERHAGCHRLGHHEAERLGPDAGEDHELHLSKRSSGVTWPRRTAAVPRLPTRRVHRGDRLRVHVARVAGQEQAYVAGDHRHGARQHVHALVGRQPAEVAHGSRPLAGGRRRGAAAPPSSWRAACSPGSRVAASDDGTTVASARVASDGPPAPARGRVGPGGGARSGGVARGGERRHEAVAPQHAPSLAPVPGAQPRM